ncbi:MAG: NAD-dependent epimerase/dehydratase family protein [Candidatus Levybacteria bacterium]|nr:NAD-dependent epimerase/dehydratase family protein [Candidatus Levybacteria bacterium]
MKKILVTGAFGLIGTELVAALQEKYGKENVIAAAHSKVPDNFDGILEKADVTKKDELVGLVKKHDIGTVYHLAGILSVGSEKNPGLAWEVNLDGLKNVLDVAVEEKLKIFWPSSIAAFGPTTPKENTPQHTVLEPTTIYGVAKVSGELLCQYYFNKFGIDVRSLRYPGINGWKADPGDGTTEYAIHIFYAALKEGKYVSPLKPGTYLPMMYMNDAILGTIQLMEADPAKLTVRTSYNFAGISFSPDELVEEIKKLMPNFSATYEPNHTQAIADSWPKSIDDSQAKSDWGWEPKFKLPEMTQEMLENLRKKLNIS